MNKSELHEIDVYAGLRLKEARKQAGVSQQKLADKCGITFQQIQKYETGHNRMSVSRLCQIAGITGKPVFWFFPDKYGGDMAKMYLKIEGVVKSHREKEDRILEILTEG